jgi:uncharacterized protein (TIGR03435 family)
MQLTLFAATALFLSACLSQETKPGLEFEVASVKPAPPLSPANFSKLGFHIEGASLIVSGMSLAAIIGRAYNHPQSRIDGPAFLTSSRFDIVAKIPEGTREDQVLDMLRSLLKERFGLHEHRENRQVKGYILTVDNRDRLENAKARPTELPPSKLPREGGRYTRIENAPLSRFPDILISILGSPVLDATKTEGRYTLWIELPPSGEGPGASSEVLHSLAECGLKLQPGRFSLEYLIVDAIRQTPTEN